jgi:hypothetical protein
MKRFCALLTINLFNPWPFMILALSMFQRFSGLIALITGISNFWNQAFNILEVALLTRAESILNCFLVLRTGFRRRKPVIYFLLSGSLSCLAAKIRPAKTRICICVGLSPKLSWTKTQSVKRCSWIGESFWSSVAPFERETWPLILLLRVPLGGP